MEVPRLNTSDQTFGDVFSTINPNANESQNVSHQNFHQTSVQNAEQGLSHPDDKMMSRIMAMYSQNNANTSSPSLPSSAPPAPHSTFEPQTPSSPMMNHHMNGHNSVTQNLNQNSMNQVSSPAVPPTPTPTPAPVYSSVESPVVHSHSTQPAVVEPNPHHVTQMMEQLHLGQQKNAQGQQALMQYLSTHATGPITQLTNQNREMMTQMQMYFERITRFMEGVERRLNNLENVTSDILKAQSRENRDVPIEKSFADKREFDAVRRAAEQYERDAEFAKKLQQQFEADSKSTPTPPPPMQQRPLSMSTPTMITTPTPRPVPVPTMKSAHSNEAMEPCPICGTSIVVSVLQDHVNECLDGGLNASSAKSTDPAQNGSLWKRIFGGKKDDEVAASNNGTAVTTVKSPEPLPPVIHQQPSSSLYPGTHSPPRQQQQHPAPPSLYGQPNYPGYPSFASPAYPTPSQPAYPQQQQQPQGYYYYAVPPGK